LGSLSCFKLAAGSVRQIVMGRPLQLVSWDLDCRQQLQCRREQRSFLSVRGLGGAQDICAISVFRSPWPIYPSLSLPLSSHIRGSGPIRCSPFSSVWKRSPSNSNASGELQSVEELWKEYFADPTQWWDNRADKIT